MGGGPRMWIKKFLNVNTINFEKVDKPRGGGADNVEKVILLTFGIFGCIFGHFHTCLVVFSQGSDCLFHLKEGRTNDRRRIGQIWLKVG